MRRPFYGYDRHMKSIHHGSIVRFVDNRTGNQRVGHVWEGEDWEDKTRRCWNISFNHTFSESGQPIEWGHDYRVIGDVELSPDDEWLLNLDVDRSSACQSKGWGNMVRWVPYPHFTA